VEHGSSLSNRPVRRRDIPSQHQLCVVNDIADITVVADQADPAVLPLLPHQVTGFCRLRAFEAAEKRHPLGGIGRPPAAGAGTFLKMDPPAMAEAGGEGQFFRAADGAGTKVLTPP
jgi:hypothetical protein